MVRKQNRKEKKTGIQAEKKISRLMRFQYLMMPRSRVLVRPRLDRLVAIPLVSLLLSLVLLACDAAQSDVSVLGLHQEKKEYEDSQGTRLTGTLWYVKQQDAGKRPGILVIHEWWGLNDYAQRRAQMLAMMGYTAFAADMYGDGKVTDHPETATEFSQQLMSDLPTVQDRFSAAMKTLQAHETVSEEAVSAIGYCMGGTIVLNMARMGIDLKGVASFHGGLPASAVATTPEPKITSKVRVFTGADDALVPPERVRAFAKEMQRRGVADYKIKSYADAVHAFTNPGATATGEKYEIANLRYNRYADADSWARFSLFLSELYR